MESLLIQFLKDGNVSSKLSSIIRDLYSSYSEACKKAGKTAAETEAIFTQLLTLVNQNISQPYTFGIFHQCIREPFDYYKFGLDFIRPLIDEKRSKVLGEERIDQIAEQLSRGENVIFLANHQTEPDSQILMITLEKRYPKLAQEIIFVAGHRVIEDPMAIPLSMGSNLLCVYSKKYIDEPPEDKPKKVSHNQRTMKKMGELLKEGGKCIYMAPSGGRDRPDEKGVFHVAPFDPDSLEMFWLMAQNSGKKTHFYPLALLTHEILPPPKAVEKELGERRLAKHTPVYLAFGKEFDMENSVSPTLDKKERRNQRAKLIWQLVQDEYNLLRKN